MDKKCWNYRQRKPGRSGIPESIYHSSNKSQTEAPSGLKRRIITFVVRNHVIILEKATRL